MMLEGSLLMSLQTLSHPSFLAGNALGKRTQCKGKLNSSTALKLSSVPLTDESENSPKPTWLLSQPKTVGVIGGVTVLSTLIFLEKLACWSSRYGKECLPFVVCSDPALSKVFPQNSPPSARSRIDHIKLNKGLVIENLKGKRKFLQDSGAGCLVMPCHLSHAWHSEISEDCSIPFLHIGECVAMQLKKAKLKPIHGIINTVRIGVLSTDDILVASYYLEKLQSQGFEVVLLDKATEEHTMIPVIDALNRKDMEGARNLLRIAIHALLIRAVNVVILASDVLTGILPHNDPLLRKCIDPMDALARSTMLWAESTENVHEKI